MTTEVFYLLVNMKLYFLQFILKMLSSQRKIILKKKKPTKIDKQNQIIIK